jgi:hypothetical protein
MGLETRLLRFQACQFLAKPSQAILALGKDRLRFLFQGGAPTPVCLLDRREARRCGAALRRYAVLRQPRCPFDPHYPRTQGVDGLLADSLTGIFEQQLRFGGFFLA